MIYLETQSIRAQILQKLGERCQALLVLLPGGADTEPEVLWARQSLHPTELPAAVVNPHPEDADRTYGVDQLTMPVTISLACLLGEHNAVDLSESLLAEIRKRVPLDDPTLGGLAQDLRYVQGGTDDYPTEDDQALVVNATFEIDYETTINNPDEGV
ncbi:MAG: hypothetical protein KAT62_00760 [Desulfuromonadales bacterium]|nr:hypothetical protein [Desulfuromonadales bacterium]